VHRDREVPNPIAINQSFKTSFPVLQFLLLNFSLAEAYHRDGTVTYELQVQFMLL